MSGKRTINYINGVSPATARKIACFVFKGFYVNLIENKKEHTFDVFLKKGIDLNKVKAFREYWGQNWKILIVTGEEQ
jgi:hypothetical protein